MPFRYKSLSKSLSNLTNDLRNKFNIQSRLFRIRIGIHTGEYSRVGDDYYGECIDGASILEPLAPYGGILISSYSNSLLE